jgi:hypothetical protein
MIPNLIRLTFYACRRSLAVRDSPCLLTGGKPFRGGAVQQMQAWETFGVAPRPSRVTRCEPRVCPLLGPDLVIGFPLRTEPQACCLKNRHRRHDAGLWGTELLHVRTLSSNLEPPKRIHPKAMHPGSTCRAWKSLERFRLSCRS